MGTPRPHRHRPSGGRSADIVSPHLTPLLFRFSGVWGCLCPSVYGIYGWYWQVLSWVPPSAPCSSAGGHWTVSLVLAEAIGCLGGGVDLGGCLGNLTFTLGMTTPRVARRKPSDLLCMTCAEMAMELSCPADPGKGLQAQSSICIFRVERCPASAFREPFSVLLCEVFLRSACIPFLVVNWFRRSFVDSSASKVLRVCCLSSFFLPSQEKL